MGKAARLKRVTAPAAPMKLDFGCGPHKRDGFQGVDAIAFPGVDHVYDVRKAPWPWADGSVEEAHASHFIEHLTAIERCRFFNELYRVLVPGGKIQIIVPHCFSSRAYGDPTHQWPPIGEMWFYYLNREWRLANAPHTDTQWWKDGYACDFEATGGYNIRPDLVTRNQEYQQYALQNFKEAAQDSFSTLTKRG